MTKDGQKVTVLFIRDLGVVSDDLIDFFSSYGEVLTVERSMAASFPNLCNGNRILKLILNEDLLCVAISVVCGIVDNLFSVLCAVNLVIGPSPAHSLADAAIVIKLAIRPEKARAPGTCFLLFLLMVMLIFQVCRIPLLLSEMNVILSW